jgi:hypothetical protein
LARPTRTNSYSTDFHRRACRNRPDLRMFLQPFPYPYQASSGAIWPNLARLDGNRSSEEEQLPYAANRQGITGAFGARWHSAGPSSQRLATRRATACVFFCE